MQIYPVQFPSLTLNLIGTNDHILLFDNFFKKLQHDEQYGISPNIQSILNKIIEYDLYCYAYAQTKDDEEILLQISATLDIYNLYLSEVEYLEALLFYRPKNMMKILNIPQDDLYTIMKNSRWAYTTEPFDQSGDIL